MRGFVTITDEKYMPMAGMLVKSILQFSQYPIAVFHIGRRSPWYNGKIFTRTAPELSTYHNNTCYMKAKCCLLSGFKDGFWIDADSVALPGIDNVFTHVPENTPLLQEITGRTQLPVSPQIKQYLGVQDIKTYRQAHGIRFNTRTTAFLRCLDAVVRERPQEAEENRGFDEHWWNALLSVWGNGAAHIVDRVDHYHDKWRGAKYKDSYYVHNVKSTDVATEILKGARR